MQYVKTTHLLPLQQLVRQQQPVLGELLVQPRERGNRNSCLAAHRRELAPRPGVTNPQFYIIVFRVPAMQLDHKFPVTLR